MSSIKTPDQRVRVFVSSTMRELEEERKAATEAISSLKLIPVLFELGARPHPPRDLYMAYLEQSHIFVGIYWNSYGWIAPGMQLSGLEDEYRLAKGKPQLIYVKKSTGEREHRLSELLSTIEKSEAVCYRAFSSTDELNELLKNDLALLLSEKFEATIIQPAKVVLKKQGTLPYIRTPLLGRDKDLERLKEMITQRDIYLITLCGTGGTGKTRFAIQFAHDTISNFKDGVYFIPLASVTDENLLADTIAHHIGIYDKGNFPIKELVMEYLQDKEALLLLDNFEQIISAGILVAEIMQRCPSIKILVTSRMPLHIRGEHVFQLAPLANPGKEVMVPSALLEYPSIELFVQRALEVNPSVELNDDNLNAIVEICRRLDGLPLAIELAASRTKFLSPHALLKRMESALSLLSRGPKDLPERQQTLRSTIDWSYNLLEEKVRKFFYRHAVFTEGWTLEASQAVAGYDGDGGIDVLDATEKLVDIGLLRLTSYYDEEKVSVEPRFTMLQTINEYAQEKLEQSGESHEVKLSHLKFFLGLAEETHPYLWTARPEPWLDRMEREYANLRTAFNNAMDAKQIIPAWQLIGAMGTIWLTRGRLSEAGDWVTRAGITIEEAEKLFRTETLDKKQIVRALLTAGMIRIFEADYLSADLILQRSYKLYDELGEKAYQARVKTFLGICNLNLGNPIAAVHLQEAIELGIDSGDVFSPAIAGAFLGETCIAVGKMDEAKKIYERGEEFCLEHDFKSGLAVILTQKGNLHLTMDEYSKAIEYHRRSLQLFDETGQKPIKGWSHIGLAFALILKNELEDVPKNIRDGLNNARETGDKALILFALTGASALAVKEGNCRRAAQLLGASEAVSEEIKYVSWTAEIKLRQWVLNEGCKGLEPAMFSIELAEGRRIPFEKALGMALEEVSEKKKNKVAL